MCRTLTVIVLTIMSLPCATLAQETCEGDKPIVHDDGTYRFSTQSWVRQGNGVHQYGRCIEVRDPTKKLRNTWEGVLAKNSIAKDNRPTIGIMHFLTRNTVDATARLFYGNSDSEIDASYLAHSHELELGDESGDPVDRSRISELLERLGVLILESFHQVTFLMVDGDRSSEAELDFRFNSQREGQSHLYTVSYDLDILSDDYSSQPLYARFSDELLTTALAKSTGVDRFNVREGSKHLQFQHNLAVQSDFVLKVAEIVDADGNVLTELPIVYLLPVQ